MNRRRFVAGLAAGVATLAMIHPADAQLVAVDRTYQVIKVDESRQRLEVAAPGAEHTSSYVLVNGNTRVTRQGQKVHWATIPVGTLINVHGGLTWDMKVQAQTIWYLQ